MSTKTSRTPRPKFIFFRIHAAPEGAVLYALDRAGWLWERYPDRPWGRLTFEGATS